MATDSGDQGNPSSPGRTDLLSIDQQLMNQALKECLHLLTDLHHDPAMLVHPLVKRVHHQIQLRICYCLAHSPNPGLSPSEISALQRHSLEYLRRPLDLHRELMLPL